MGQNTGAYPVSYRLLALESNSSQVAVVAASIDAMFDKLSSSILVLHALVVVILIGQKDFCRSFDCNSSLIRSAIVLRVLSSLKYTYFLWKKLVNCISVCKIFLESRLCRF